MPGPSQSIYTDKCHVLPSTVQNFSWSKRKRNACEVTRLRIEPISRDFNHPNRELGILQAVFWWLGCHFQRSFTGIWNNWFPRIASHPCILVFIPWPHSCCNVHVKTCRRFSRLVSAQFPKRGGYQCVNLVIEALVFRPWTVGTYVCKIGCGIPCPRAFQPHFLFSLSNNTITNSPFAF